MKLIVGLGNPGPEYENTRHNVGFRVVDELAGRHRETFVMGPTDALIAKVRLADASTMLAKPLTYMNLSGRAITALCRYFRVDIDDLLVVADDVNLPLARMRARGGGSPGGHNGLASVQESLGTSGYARLRVGVGRGDERRDLSNYVLSRFGREETDLVTEMVGRAAEAAEMFITEGLDRMMNRYNQEDLQAPRQDDE